MRESLIHVRAGGEAGHASKAAAPGDSDHSSAGDGQKGLLVEVAGLANISSTEVTEQATTKRKMALGYRLLSLSSLRSPQSVLVVLVVPPFSVLAIFSSRMTSFFAPFFAIISW